MGDQRLMMRRRNMQAWIRRGSILVSLKRPTTSTTSAGGVAVGEPQSLFSQAFRFAPARSALVFTTVKIEGRIRSDAWVLVGHHDADVQAKDYFEHEGRWYEVDEVSATDVEVYKLAIVVERGKA